MRGREAPPRPPLPPPSAPPCPPGPLAPRRRWCRSPRWARPQPSRRPASAPHGSLLLSLTPSAMAAAAAEQQQFYLLLGNLLSPDNVVRKQAEVSQSAAPAARRADPSSPATATTSSAGPARWPSELVGRAAQVGPGWADSGPAAHVRRSRPAPALPARAAAAPVASPPPRAHVPPRLTRRPARSAAGEPRTPFPLSPPGPPERPDPPHPRARFPHPCRCLPTARPWETRVSLLPVAAWRRLPLKTPFWFLERTATSRCLQARGKLPLRDSC